MKIVAKQVGYEGSLASVDAVERKGIGHPDSLADIIADEFSRAYCEACLERWGVVLNHWVDKVNLVGCAAKVEFGRFLIDKPITVHLFGKVTVGIGRELIDLDGLLRQATRDVLRAALGETDIDRHINFNIENTSGVGVDHLAAFYEPSTVEELKEVHRRESVANDTVLCSAYAAVDDLASHAIELENAITDPIRGLIAQNKLVGTDVKVVLIRRDDWLRATVCVPGHADRISSMSEYRDMLGSIGTVLTLRLDSIAEVLKCSRVELALNTKDTATSAYICPFGTSLGKGDCGAVGRGNKINGVINALRASTAEAPSGKNPLHHVGKLYTISAQVIANRVVEEFGASSSEVLIATDNGRPLVDPSFVSISFRGDAISESSLKSLVQETLDMVPSLWKTILRSSPYLVFRKGGLTSLARTLVASQ